MRRLFFLSALIALFSCAAAVQAKAGEPVGPRDKDTTVKQLTEADNGTTMKIAVGAKFDIALKGNATTGYQWKVAKIVGDAVVQKGEPDYVVEKRRKRMVGVGGTFLFHFEVKKAGKTKVELGYARPWEKDTPPVKTFVVTIDSSK
jgi:inhibitor of cysteine peptidase